MPKAYKVDSSLFHLVYILTHVYVAVKIGDYKNVHTNQKVLPITPCLLKVSIGAGKKSVQLHMKAILPPNKL